MKIIRFLVALGASMFCVTGFSNDAPWGAIITFAVASFVAGSFFPAAFAAVWAGEWMPDAKAMLSDAQNYKAGGRAEYKFSWER